MTMTIFSDNGNLLQNTEIAERCVALARHIIKSGDTVRTTAKKFGISKSTVHKDITERLPKVDPALLGDALNVLERNKGERHLRGGAATKARYMAL